MKNLSYSVGGLLAAMVFVGLVVVLPPGATDFSARVIVHMQQEIDTMRVFVKGDKYLLQRTADGVPIDMLVDRKQQVMDAWNPAQPQYHESDLSNFLVAMMDPFAAIDLTVTMSKSEAKKVGTETVRGYTCDKYVIKTKDGPELIDYWVARKLGFPIKFTEPMEGGATLDVSEITEGPVPDSLMHVPAGYTLAVDSGEAPPAWSGDVANAPLVSLPYRHVMSAGQIIRVRPRIGEKVEVACSDAVKGSQFVGVPFKNGKPIENYMMDTFTLNPGDKWTKPFDPFSTDEDELVIRMNKGRGMIVVRPAKTKER